MNTDQLRTAVQAVVAADPDVADRDELAGMVAAARRLRAALDRVRRPVLAEIP